MADLGEVSWRNLPQERWLSFIFFSFWICWNAIWELNCAIKETFWFHSIAFHYVFSFSDLCSVHYTIYSCLFSFRSTSTIWEINWAVSSFFLIPLNSTWKVTKRSNKNFTKKPFSWPRHVSHVCALFARNAVVDIVFFLPFWNMFFHPPTNHANNNQHCSK